MNAILTVFWDGVTVLAIIGATQLLCGHHRMH